jgi:hypothetical protein
MNWTSFLLGVGVVVALLVAWLGAGEEQDASASEESWQSIMDAEKGGW